MPFIFCLYFLKKSNSKDIKVFFVYTTLLFISILAVIIFRYIFKSYSLYIIVLRIFILGEFLLISQFFVNNTTNLKVKRFIQLLIIPFSLFSLYDYFASVNEEFTYYPQVLECLLFPLIIILFFYEKMKYSTKFPIYQSPAFWIAVAFLIFSTGNFFLFLFSKMLVQDLASKHLYNNIYGFFTILKNVLLCTAVIVYKNSKFKEEQSNINNINLELDAFIPFKK